MKTPFACRNVQAAAYGVNEACLRAGHEEGKNALGLHGVLPVWRVLPRRRGAEAYGASSGRGGGSVMPDAKSSASRSVTRLAPLTPSLPVGLS